MCIRDSIYRASDGAKVTSITTDEHGHASCELTPNTSYYAIEVKAPAGFSLNKQRIEFSTGDSEGSVPLSDKAGTVRLIIAKKDSATGGKAQVGASLEGAEFRVKMCIRDRLNTVCAYSPCAYAA